ncbi:MAG: choice-of-anchor Q domain-containing protein, partial [candidate division WOR-3 bacterium]
YQGGDGSNRPYDRPDGFGIEASEGPIEISNTTATHNYGDGLDSKAKRTYIHECIVANNSCDGVKLWGDSSRVVNTLIYGRGDGDRTITPWSPIVICTENHNAYFEIINCTVDDSIGENYIMHVQYDSPTIPVNLRIVNTIFCSRGNNAPVIWLAEAVNYDIKYNLFYAPKDDRLLIQGNTTYTSAEVGQIGTGNIYGNPQFNSFGWGTEGNYHLKSGSPGINAGDSLSAPAIDLEGKSRPQGNGVDIGCYEQ